MGISIPKLLVDSCSTANQSQNHSSNHNADNSEYRKTSECRFCMARELGSKSHVDKFGVVRVKRDDLRLQSGNCDLFSDNGLQ